VRNFVICTLHQVSIKMRWAGHAARVGQMRNAYKFLVGEPGGKRPRGRPRRRWEDNSSVDRTEICWWAFMNTVMNIRVRKIRGIS
jgi:hypothetical protein